MSLENWSKAEEILEDQPQAQSFEPPGTADQLTMSSGADFNAMKMPVQDMHSIDLGFTLDQTPYSTGRFARLKALLGIKPARRDNPRLTPTGHMKMIQPGFLRRRTLRRLYSGEADVRDYTVAVCYDAVAYCWALDDRIPLRTLEKTTGLAWIDFFGFQDKGEQWSGGEIPKGSAVGLQYADTGEFFHCTITPDDGTSVRGVNSNTTTPGWSTVFDLQDLWNANNKRYELQGKHILVWHVLHPKLR